MDTFSLFNCKSLDFLDEVLLCFLAWVVFEGVKDLFQFHLLVSNF